ncbi:MAG: hypothetical protein CMH57_09210 [Myxococcales bacterium]|nr:hypothetical protein [Myxococcales bacterium]
MANEDKAFKRINFFKGFVTTEEDWNEAERYHVEKRKLHNRAFHGVGVVPGWKDEFKVVARGKGELSVEVSPGYAIDGQGHDIILWKPSILQLNKGDYKLPQTIYLVVRFVEEHTDFIAYKQNLDYKGHRRIAEMCKLEWTEQEPNSETEIELCRVQLTREAVALEMPKNPLDPSSNQIDRRFVPYAGVAGGVIHAQLLWQLSQLIEGSRRMFISLAQDEKVISANNVVQALITLGMLMETGALGPNQIMNILSLLADLELAVVSEIEATKPGISAKKDFSLFKRNIEYLRDTAEESVLQLQGGGSLPLDKLDELVSYQDKASSSLRSIMPNVSRRSVAKAADTGDAGEAEERSMILHELEGWKEIMVKSTPFEDSMAVDATTWTLIDEIDMLDKDSEESHNFDIKEATDQYRTRQRLRYPDGTLVADSGIAHEGGYAEWEILNVTPAVDLVIIRRMDFVRADYECDIYCEGKLIGVIPCPGSDKRFRWRNWPFLIPAKYITKNRLRIRQQIKTAERDLNFFHLWFYQAL